MTAEEWARFRLEKNADILKEKGFAFAAGYILATREWKSLEQQHFSPAYMAGVRAAIEAAKLLVKEGPLE